MKMGLLLALVALGGIGFVLLRKPLEERALIEAVSQSPELGATIEGAAETAAIRDASLSTMKTSVESGDIIGAIVGVIGYASAGDWRTQENTAWADSIIAIWAELPDSWFLERTRVQAGLEVEAYIPPRAVKLFSWDDMFNSVTNGTAYLRPHYDRVREAYRARLTRMARDIGVASADQPAWVEAVGQGTERPVPLTDVQRSTAIEAMRALFA